MPFQYILPALVQVFIAKYAVKILFFHRKSNSIVKNRNSDYARLYGKRQKHPYAYSFEVYTRVE